MAEHNEHNQKRFWDRTVLSLFVVVQILAVLAAIVIPLVEYWRASQK